jgi:hypothetical protein
MSSYDNESFDNESYSETAWDILLQLLPDGVKVWIRHKVYICKNLYYKVDT